MQSHPNNVLAPGGEFLKPQVSNNVQINEKFVPVDVGNGNQYIHSLATGNYLRNYPEDQWHTNTVDVASWSYEGEERCIADTGLGYWTIEPVVTKANLRFNDAGAYDK